ncbi:MAG: insulinase family protein [Acidimicrobiia bacterium]|nr:insulinase family protein [Acidimicrobiia bacterium]
MLKKKCLTGFLLLALAAGAFAQTRAQVPKPAAVVKTHKEIKLPELNPITVPQVHKHVLPNGLTLFLVEDPELPLVRAQAVIRTGERWEPAAKAGLADIALRVMRTGGSTTRSGDALDKDLDRLSMTVETGAGKNSSSASIFALKEDGEKAFTILADLLRNPAFPQDKIDLAKIDMRDSIARRNDEPMGIHGREQLRLLYGKNSAYARQMEYATLDSITRDDLVNFHKQYFQPENVILAVWGDFKAPAMKTQMEKVFGSWAKGGKPKPEAPQVDPQVAGKPGIYLIDKDDVTQSTLAMSMLLGRRDDPDYHAMVVMTNVLGGSFGSRMTNNIRAKEGLAYMAFSHYAAEFDHAGMWFAQTGTKSGTTIKALELMRQEIARMKEVEPTDDEMSVAKDGILRGEAFDFDSTGKIVGRLATYEYYGYPSDYLQRYREGIKKVTKADVLRAAQKYLDMDKFQILVLGKSKDFDKPLSSLGTVTPVDVTIPQPKGAEVSAATDETRAKGVALLTRARQLHGGDAIKAVKQYQAKMDLTMVTPQGEMSLGTDATVDLADVKYLMKIASPMGEIIQAFDGEKGWMKTPQGVQDAPPAVADQARKNAVQDNISLLSNFDAAGYAVQAVGISKLGDKDVEGVLVKNEALKLEVTMLIDPATGMLAGKGYQGALMGPPGALVETFSEMRDVGGVKLPFHVSITNNGRKAAEQKVSEYKLNPGVSDDIYKKPQ